MSIGPSCQAKCLAHDPLSVHESGLSPTHTCTNGHASRNPSLRARPPASWARPGGSYLPWDSCTPSPGCAVFVGGGSSQDSQPYRSQGGTEQPPVRVGPTNSDPGPAALAQVLLELQLPRGTGKATDHEPGKAGELSGAPRLPWWRALGYRVELPRTEGRNSFPPQTFTQFSSFQGPAQAQVF